MVDYSRRYGQFSRAFIAKQVQRSLRPAFFDFMRYEDKGGLRPLPLIVAKPWALTAYTRLMAKSTIRSKMHEELVAHGHLPRSELTAGEAPDLPIEARAAEKLSSGAPPPAKLEDSV